MNCIFGGGGRGGSGREGQINKYVWGYDEIIFFYVLGSHFYQFGAFLWSRYRFLGLLNFKYFLGMPDTFGDRE